MRYWCYDLTKLICWLFFRLGFGLEVCGEEHIPEKGPFILASNHFSFLDPPLIGVASPRRLGFMARQDLYRHPPLGLFLRSVGAIPLQRGEADLAAIRLALEHLSRGEPIAIFPEGTRQASGRLGEAKRGVGFLAARAKVPVIPALVQGTFEALPPGAKALRRSKIRVAFGEAITYTKASPPSTSLPETAQAAGVESPAAKGGGGEARPTHLAQESVADALTRQWRQMEAAFKASAGTSRS